MFTGIVADKCRIVQVQHEDGHSEIVIDIPPKYSSGLQLGNSVCVDGVCLTVASINNSLIKFDIIKETIRCTTLGDLGVGDFVNIERAAKVGQEIGGHEVSGHIDTTAEINWIDTTPGNVCMRFQLTKQENDNVFNKGFIAINGCSLTVANVKLENQTFDVWLIPETLRLTTFGEKSVTQKVNIEFDRHTQVLVECIKRTIQRSLAGSE